MHGDQNSIHDHIIIVGWSERTIRIIQQLRNEQNFSPDSMVPILVISSDNDPKLMQSFDRVYIINGDIYNVSTFKRANISSAKAILIPSLSHKVNTSDGGTLLTMFTALAAAPNIRICVELENDKSAESLRLITSRIQFGPNVEFVSFEAITEKLLAQVAINPGITKVYDHLLSFDESNEIYVIDIPTKWLGATYRSFTMQCFDNNLLVIGYENTEGLFINPPNRDYQLRADDKGWFIASSRDDLEKILNA